MTAIQSPFGNNPTGPAGGSLTGTYPNPGLSAAAVAASQNWPWLPGDNNLLVANGGDPGLVSSTVVVTAGTLYLSQLLIRSAITITNIWLGMPTAGTGASTGSFVGLYNSAGTLLSGSSDIHAQIVGSAGPISAALTTPQAVAAGTFVWGAFLVNLASTQPTMGRLPSQGSSGIANLGLTAAAFRFAVNGTLLTSLPASITPASNATPAGADLWLGAS